MAVEAEELGPAVWYQEEWERAALATEGCQQVWCWICGLQTGHKSLSVVNKLNQLVNCVYWQNKIFLYQRFYAIHKNHAFFPPQQDKEESLQNQVSLRRLYNHFPVLWNFFLFLLGCMLRPLKIMKLEDVC